MPDRIADLMAWGLSEGVARRVASRDRPVGPVRDQRSEAARLEALLATRDRLAQQTPRERLIAGMDPTLAGTRRSAAPAPQPPTVTLASLAGRESPPDELSFGLNPKRWIEEQVFTPAVSGVGSLIGALDRPPTGYPADMPYTSPLRIASSAFATMPAAAGLAYDALTGTRPKDLPVVDPLRPSEEQATFRGEVARRGGGRIAQVFGTVADLLVGPEHGLQLLGAAAPVFMGAGKLTKVAKEAQAARALTVTGEMAPFTTLRNLPKTARPIQIFDEIVRPGSTGYTVHPRTGEVVVPGTKDTFMVGMFPNGSVRTKVIPLKSFTPKSVESFIKENADVFNKHPDAHAGGWVDNGVVYLDVSTRSESLREATKIGENQPLGKTAKPWTQKQKDAGIPRQWEWKGEGSEPQRSPDGSWPLGQEAIGDLTTNPASFPKVGRLPEFVESAEFQQRLDEMASAGRGAMGEDFKNWWDITKGPLARVYGQEMVDKVAGLIAATSPQNGPISNIQMASELIRRAIKGEPMRQSAWRAPATAMGDMTGKLAAGGTKGGFSPKPGAAFPGENTWANNAELIMAGRGSEISQDKVNDMRRALLGDKDVAVIDRHYAKMAEKPEAGVFTSETANKVDTSMASGKRESYPTIENAVRTGARRAGVDLSQYSAWVWEGIRKTIRETGQLFGQTHRASAIPATTTGFNEIFEEIIPLKAKHLGISVSELERRLRSGDAELLGAVLSTGVGTAAYKEWVAGQSGAVDPQAPASAQ